MQKNILITRLKNDSEILQQELIKYGLNAISLPLIELKQIKLHSEEIVNIKNFDLLIFTSKPAVEYLFNQIDNNDYENFNIKQIRIAAIGKSSAELLEKKGITNIIYPKGDCYTSESLWPYIEKTNLKNKQIGLIKGFGGRDYLSTKIIEQGAKVKEFNVYKRVLPENAEALFVEEFNNCNIDIIIITCKTSLNNIIYLANKHKISVFNISILTISDRLYLEAKKLGFTKILVAKNAIYESIVEKLKQKGLIL